MDKELKIKIKVDADTGELIVTKNEFEKLSTVTKTTNTTLEEFSSKIKAMAGLAVGVLAIKSAFDAVNGTVKEFINTSSQYEQYTNRLKSFYSSTKEVTNELKRAREFADKYNRSIEDTLEAFIKMKVYGIDASNKALKTFTNTAIGSGKSLDQFVEAMADAFTGENERLKEFGVKANVIGEKIAYSWSNSSGKAMHVVIKNNRKIIESTLTAIFNEKYAGQMELYKNSWAGYVQGMKTKWEELKLSFYDAGLFGYFKALGKTVITVIDDSLDFGKTKAKEWSTTTISYIEGVIKAFFYVKKGFDVVVEVFEMAELAILGLSKAIMDMINLALMPFITTLNQALRVYNKVAKYFHKDKVKLLNPFVIDTTWTQNEINNIWNSIKKRSEEWGKDSASKNAQEFINKVKIAWEKEKKAVQNSNKEKEKALQLLKKLGAKYGQYSSTKTKLDKKGAKEYKKVLDKQKKQWQSYSKYVETEWDKTTKYLYNSLEKNFFDALDGKFHSLKDMFKSFANDIFLNPMKHGLAKNLSGATLAKLGIPTIGGATLGAYLGKEGFKEIGGQFVKWIGDTKVVIDKTGKVLQGQEKVSKNILSDLSTLKSGYEAYKIGLQNAVMKPFYTSGTWLAQHGYTTLGSGVTSFGVGLANPFNANIVASQGGWGTIAGASAGAGQIVTGAGAGYLVGSLGDKLFGADTKAADYGAIGAGIGTAIAPGIGTAIGAIGGSIIGGLFGSTKTTDTGLYFKDNAYFGNINAQSYEHKHKKSWFSSSSWDNFKDLDKNIKSQINNVFGTYDYLLTNLVDFHGKVSIKAGKYSKDKYQDEIARIFLNKMTGLNDTIKDVISKKFIWGDNGLELKQVITQKTVKVNEELLKVWKDYAKSIDKSITEVLTSTFSELIQKKRSFEIWLDNFKGNKLGALKAQKKFAEADLALALKKVGDSSITSENYLQKLNEAMKNQDDLTPQMINSWEQLGDALRKSANAQKAYEDALKAVNNILDTTRDNFRRWKASFTGWENPIELGVNQLENKFKKLTKELGVTGITWENYLRKLRVAREKGLTDELAKKWSELGKILSDLTTKQRAYNRIKNREKEQWQKDIDRQIEADKRLKENREAQIKSEIDLNKKLLDSYTKKLNTLKKVADDFRQQIYTSSSESSINYFNSLLNQLEFNNSRGILDESLIDKINSSSKTYKNALLHTAKDRREYVLQLAKTANRLEILSKKDPVVSAIDKLNKNLIDRLNNPLKVQMGTGAFDFTGNAKRIAIQKAMKDFGVELSDKTKGVFDVLYKSINTKSFNLTNIPDKFKEQKRKEYSHLGNIEQQIRRDWYSGHNGTYSRDIVLQNEIRGLTRNLLTQPIKKEDNRIFKEMVDELKAVKKELQQIKETNAKTAKNTEKDLYKRSA